MKKSSVANFIFGVSFKDINDFRQHVSKEVEQATMDSYYRLTKSHDIKWSPEMVFPQLESIT